MNETIPCKALLSRITGRSDSSETIREDFVCGGFLLPCERPIYEMKMVENCDLQWQYKNVAIGLYEKYWKCSICQREVK